MDLTGNNVRDILPKTVKLPRLKSLNLSDNQLEEIPEKFLNLEHLETLDLTGNILKNISQKKVELSSLKSLKLSWNKLEKIPATKN